MIGTFGPAIACVANFVAYACSQTQFSYIPQEWLAWPPPPQSTFLNQSPRAHWPVMEATALFARARYFFTKNTTQALEEEAACR
jgi:hypothetical protein